MVNPQIPLYFDTETKNRALRPWLPLNQGAGRKLGDALNSALTILGAQQYPNGWIALKKTDKAALGITHNISLVPITDTIGYLKVDHQSQIGACSPVRIERDYLLIAPHVLRVDSGVSLTQDHLMPWMFAHPFAQTATQAVSKSLTFPWWMAPKDFQPKHHPALSPILDIITGYLLHTTSLEKTEISLKAKPASKTGYHCAYRPSPFSVDAFLNPDTLHTLKTTLNPLFHAYLESNAFPLHSTHFMVFPGTDTEFFTGHSLRLPLSAHEKMEKIAFWRSCQSLYFP